MDRARNLYCVDLRKEQSRWALAALGTGGYLNVVLKAGGEHASKERMAPDAAT